MASHTKILSTLGGAAAWPVAARAQQPAMPVIAPHWSRSDSEQLVAIPLE